MQAKGTHNFMGQPVLLELLMFSQQAVSAACVQPATSYGACLCQQRRRLIVLALYISLEEFVNVFGREHPASSMACKCLKIQVCSYAAPTTSHLKLLHCFETRPLLAVQQLLQQRVLVNLTVRLSRVSLQGPDVAVHHPDETLAAMNEWCTSHHTASGLVKRCQQSQTSMAEAEQQLLAFIQPYTRSVLTLSAFACQLMFIFKKPTC